MTKVKTEKAKGVVLNWLVAVASGMKWSENGTFTADHRPGEIIITIRDYLGDWKVSMVVMKDVVMDVHSPRPNWPQYKAYTPSWSACGIEENNEAYGDTELEARLRCFVMVRLGREYDVPDIIETYTMRVLRSACVWSPPLHHPNSGMKWEGEEEFALKRAFNDGATLEELMLSHGRAAGGILSRLAKVGLLKFYNGAYWHDAHTPWITCDQVLKLKRSGD